MLEYESPWGNPSHMIPNDPEDSDHQHQQHNHSPEINMFNNNNNNQHSAAPLSLDYANHNGFAHQPPNLTQNAFSQHHFFQHQADQTAIYDPRAFPITSYQSHHNQMADSMTGLNPNTNMSTGDGSGYFLVPKTEEGVGVGTGRQGTRIGLNLGHRTYFSAHDDDFVNRLYRRSRHGGLDSVGVNTPRCQAEGCVADLSNAKHYHRRHKVCEYHSKASTVTAGGLTQRFCQQCSRFHLLTEFDNGKRSCRKRLADHNRRRRKTPQQQPAQQQSQLELQKSPVDNSSPDYLARSPPESAITHPSSSSSVTIAISARMTLDCFRQRSSSSSGSVFYSN